MMDQHAKLKQHTSDLESALSQREAALVEFQAANMSASRKYDQVDEEQRLRVRQLEEDLNQQTTLSESLQRQVSRQLPIILPHSPLLVPPLSFLTTTHYLFPQSLSTS